jgi:NADPH:quinone reductase-like Zn-dependent oxidoreductase
VVGIQIALWRGASRVFVPSRSAEKIALLDEFLGGPRVEVEYIDTARHSFAEIVPAQTQQRGVDVIIDTVGAAALEGNVKCAL